MYIPFSRPQKHRLKQSWDPPWTPQIQWEREKSLRIFMQMKSLVDSPGPTFHAPIPQVLAVGINGYKWINKYRQISNIIKYHQNLNNYQQLSTNIINNPWLDWDSLNRLNTSRDLSDISKPSGGWESNFSRRPSKVAACGDPSPPQGHSWGEFFTGDRWPVETGEIHRKNN